MFIAVDLVACGQIVDVAVIASVKSGETRTHIGAQRHVNGRTTAIFGLREERTFNRRAKFCCWTLRYDADNTSRCVLSKQCTLRSAQDFDTLNVEQIGKAFTSAAQDNAVENGSDRWFSSNRKVDGANAAQEQCLVQ